MQRERREGSVQAVQPEATIGQCRQSGDFDADGQAKHKQSVEPATTTTETTTQQQHKQRQQ